MAKRKTRVSPGSAAARLARWRWHRNPRTFASLIRDGDAVVNRYISTSASLEEAAAKINIALSGDYKPAEILKYLKSTRGASIRRNPGGLTLSKRLGGRLLEWHGGQSSALYRVGSRAYGGHPIQSPGDIDDALWELNRAYEGAFKPADVRHLDATIKMLERESGHQNKNNPLGGRRRRQPLQEGDVGGLDLRHHRPRRRRQLEPRREELEPGRGRTARS